MNRQREWERQRDGNGGARRFLDISRLNIRKGAAGLRGCSHFTII
ncbi:hypothetical protein [Clostridium sp. AF20-7]|nr:hypothetical protein [Clostridium sp. AF20-7]